MRPEKMHWPTRRAFIAGMGAAIAVPAVLRFGLDSLRAEEFELAGDGHTNDLPVLRQMLAEAERRGKGVIRLPAGRFRLVPDKDESAALVLPANVTLEGAGVDRTTLVMADGAFGHVIVVRYGWVRILDLTVDGNEANRVNSVGHNIRVNGDHIQIERVRVLNAVSYGIGIGQKRFARDVTVRDVEIVNAGADGIDIKNSLARTEKIVIENVTVRGFGRPDPSLAKTLIGSASDRKRNKAAVDLRGQCEVRGLTVEGILANRDGLRFRHGEKGDPPGPGAHGSTASAVVIRGAGQKDSLGVNVVARDVRIENVEVSKAWIGIFVGSENFAFTRGKIEACARDAVHVRPTRFTRPNRVAIDSVAFLDGNRFVFKDVEAVSFSRCTFSNCDGHAEQILAQDPHITLKDCRFDASCR